jgi:hypothetical protein
MKRCLLLGWTLCLLLLAGQVQGDIVREMRFKLGELDVELKYQDPTDVDIRLKDSRVLTFQFVVRNPSRETVFFRLQDIELNLGTSRQLSPVSIETVMEEIKSTKKIPSIFKVLNLGGSQSSAFHPKYHKNLEKHLRKRSLRDGALEVGKEMEGLVFFMLPDEPLYSYWASINYSHHLPQVLETKGFGVYIREKKTESSWEKFVNFYKKYFQGEPPHFDKSYALLVGNGDYRYLEPLESPARDVTKMKDFLAKQGFDQIVFVTDEHVNIEALRNPQQYFRNRIKKEDRFVFYYSGHGCTRNLPGGKKRGYLPLINEKPGYYEQSMAMDGLVNWMEQLQSKHLLVILDCCFSGLAVKGLEIKSDSLYSPEVNKEMVNRLATQPARYLLMAGKEGEVSIAGNRWAGSLFTDGFIKGIEDAWEADMFHDGFISVRELHIWLRNYVLSESNKAGRSLTPLLKDLEEYGASEGEFFFIR